MKVHLMISFLFSIVLAACSQYQKDIPYPDNPNQVFQHGGLSHGIGESLLDSPLLNDSLNAVLIIACRNGLSQRDLSSFSSDQSELNRRIDALIKAGIIVKTQDQYFTSFPILLERDHELYANLINKAVDEIYHLFMPQVINILERVDQRQWQSWSYHIIWSLIFDSQFIWYEMSERKLVPPLTTLVEWIIYPPHEFKTGTNYYPDTELKEHWVAVSWSPKGSNTLNIFGENWDPIYRLALYGIDSLSSPEIELLTGMKLINANEEAVFPVIRLEDTFYHDLKNLAEVFVNLIQDALRAQDFQPLIGSDPKMCRVMAYHDVCWEILRRLVGDGLIKRPLPLQIGTLTSEDDLTGVCSVISIYQPFIDQIMKAFEK